MFLFILIFLLSLCGNVYIAHLQLSNSRLGKHYLWQILRTVFTWFKYGLEEVNDGSAASVCSPNVVQKGHRHRQHRRRLTKRQIFDLQAPLWNFINLIAYLSVIITASVSDLSDQSVQGHCYVLSVGTGVSFASFGVTCVHLVFSPQLELVLTSHGFTGLLWALALTLIGLITLYETVLVAHHPRLEDPNEMLGRIYMYSALITFIFFTVILWTAAYWFWRSYADLRDKRKNQPADYLIPKTFIEMLHYRSKFLANLKSSFLISFLWLPYVIDLVCFRINAVTTLAYRELLFGGSICLSGTMIHPILTLITHRTTIKRHLSTFIPQFSVGASRDGGLDDDDEVDIEGSVGNAGRLDDTITQNGSENVYSIGVTWEMMRNFGQVPIPTLNFHTIPSAPNSVNIDRRRAMATQQNQQRRQISLPSSPQLCNNNMSSSDYDPDGLERNNNSSRNNSRNQGDKVDDNGDDGEIYQTISESNNTVTTADTFRTDRTTTSLESDA